jgi:hypothetical protein
MKPRPGEQFILQQNVDRSRKTQIFTCTSLE